MEKNLHDWEPSDQKDRPLTEQFVTLGGGFPEQCLCAHNINVMPGTDHLEGNPTATVSVSPYAGNVFKVKPLRMGAGMRNVFVVANNFPNPFVVAPGKVTPETQLTVLPTPQYGLDAVLFPGDILPNMS